MNEQNNQEADNQNELQENTTEINDLTVANAEQSAIKGGANKLFVGGLSGGPDSLSNHNETVTEDAEDSDTEMTPLADLPVAVEQAQQTKGGPLNYGKIEFSYMQQKPDDTL